jgi:hypothetical protein
MMNSKIIIWFIGLFIFCSIASAVTQYVNFNDTFTGVNGTNLWNGYISTGGAYACTRNLADTTINDGHAKIDYTSGNYETCEHNISSLNTLVNSSNNLTLYVQNTYKEGTGQFYAGICTVQHTSILYCGWDTSGNYGTDGYYIYVDASEKIYILRFLATSMTVLFTSAASAFTQGDNLSLELYYNVTASSRYLQVYNNNVLVAGSTKSDNTFTNFSVIGLSSWVKPVIFDNFNITTTQPQGSIADTTPPSFNENKTNQTAIYPQRNQTIQINATIADNVDISCAQLATNNSGTFKNETQICWTGLTDTSVIGIWNYTVNGTLLGDVKYQLWANDSSNNTNVSSLYYFSVKSLTPPQFSSNQTNQTSLYPKRGNVVQINVSITDDIDISCVSFATNNSGTFKNESQICWPDLADTSAKMVLNYTTNTTRKGIFQYQYWANDSNGLQTLSEIYYFEVKDFYPGNQMANNYTARESNILSDVGFFSNLTDDISLSSYIFGSNVTGTWINKSVVAITGTTYNVNESVKIYPSMKLGSFCGQLWFNDSFNQWNTTQSCYTVTEVFLRQNSILNLTDHNLVIARNITVENITLNSEYIIVGDMKISFGNSNIYTNLSKATSTYAIAGWNNYWNDSNWSTGAAIDGSGDELAVFFNFSATNRSLVQYKITDSDGVDSYFNDSLRTCSIENNIVQVRFFKPFSSSSYYSQCKANPNWITLRSFFRPGLNTKILYEASLLIEVRDNISMMNLSNTSILMNASNAPVAISIQKNKLADAYFSNHSFAAFNITVLNYTIMTTANTELMFAYTQPYYLNFTAASAISTLSKDSTVLDNQFPARVTTNTNYTKTLTCSNSTGGQFIIQNSTWTYDNSKNIVSITYSSVTGKYTSINYTHSQSSGLIYANFTAECGGDNIISIEYDTSPPYITFNYPSSHAWIGNKVNLTVNYTAYDPQTNLFRGNFSLFYENGTFAKNLYYYDDLNVSTINQSLILNWSDMPFADYYVEICFSDEVAQSPKKPDYSVSKAGLFGYKKEELQFNDKETNTDVSVTLELVTTNGALKKYDVSRGDLDVIAYKTDDNKHIVYGGKYKKSALPNGQEKKIHFRYRYHSNNDIKLKIMNSVIGLIHADTGMKTIFWHHKSLLQKGWKTSTFYEGNDIIVEFWKDKYDDIIDFDPISGGVNYVCANSSIITKSYSLNITALDSVKSNPVLNFSINMTSSAYNFSGSTTNGSILLPVENGQYFFTINSPGYVNESSNIVIANSDYNLSIDLFAINSLLLTFYESETNIRMDNKTVDIQFIGDESSFNYSTTNATLYLTGVTPDSYLIRYNSDGYKETFYYLEFVNNSYYNISIYLTLNTTATIVKAIVYDEANNLLENAIIKVLKYDAETNSYFLQDTRKTNFEGEALLNIELNKEFYKFIVEYDGESKLETNPSYIWKTTITLQINLATTVAETFYESQDIDYNLLFNNESENFRVTFNDVTNKVDSGCLKVSRIRATGETEIETSCVSNATGSILVNAPNITGATYRAEAYVNYDDESYNLDSTMHSYLDDNKLGKGGLFIVIILTIVMIFIYAWDVTVATILTPIPALFGSIIGMIDISVGYIIPIEIIAIIIAIAISERSH